MGETPGELRRQIEETREQLGETVDALTEKVTPQAAVNRARERLQERAAQVTESVRSWTPGESRGGPPVGEAMRSGGDAFRRWAESNPVRATLVTFGAGILIGRLLKRRK